MIDLFKSTFWRVIPWNWLAYIEPRFLKLIPDDLKTQEMCSEAVKTDPYTLKYVPYQNRMHEMCYRALEK